VRTVAVPGSSAGPAAVQLDGRVEVLDPPELRDRIAAAGALAGLYRISGRVPQSPQAQPYPEAGGEETAAGLGRGGHHPAP
jgi:hypothetical protein